MKTLSDVHVVLQAGGEGRRIRSIDQDTPKPLLTVGGVSLLERLIRQLVTAGFRQFTVVTGYDGPAVQEHVTIAAELFSKDIRINLHQEDRPMGNAGAITELSTSLSTVLLVFADLFTDLNFAKLVGIHRQHQNDVTLTSHWEDYQLALGELTVDGDIVRDYIEKPRKQHLICSGIAVFESGVLDAARELAQPFGLADVIQFAISHSYQISHWTHGATWMDVNTPDALQAARALADRLPSEDLAPPLLRPSR